MYRRLGLSLGQLGIGIGVGKSSGSSNWTPQFNNGKLLLMFDDGRASAFTNAYPLLITKGVKATFWVSHISSISYVDELTMSNNGMDMQCHSYSHHTWLGHTRDYILNELAQISAEFVANGLPAPVHHCYPLGQYDDAAISAISTLRKTGTVEVYNTGLLKDNNKFLLLRNTMEGLNSSGIASLKGLMDSCKLNKKALALYAHEVTASDPTSLTISQMTDLIDYALAIGMDIITISQLYALMQSECSLFTVSAIGGNKLRLSWALGVDITDEIHIERSTNGVDFTELIVKAAGTTTYDDSGLTTMATYYYRIRNKNKSKFSNYSQIQSAVVLNATDADGNLYGEVTIGTQTWLTSNLKTTKFNDGSAIPNKNSGANWSAANTAKTAAYCWSNDNVAHKINRGAMYNWWVVDDEKGIAPVGYHIPSVAEITELLTYLGGTDVAGGHAKGIAIGNDNAASVWKTPNLSADNSSGFNAYGSGARSSGGTFDYTPITDWFGWMKEQYSTANGNYYRMNYNSAALTPTNIAKGWGLTVRCIKD